MKEQENRSETGMEPLQVSTVVLAGANRRMLARTRDHEITLDVPKERGGDNAGPTPPECLTMALGGCVLNICRVLAMQKRIVLDDIQVTIKGEIDPSKAFGIPTEKRAGFTNLSVRLKLDSELTETEKEEFRLELIGRCPLCDTLGNATPLQISFEN
ncbi:OsmC family protein [Syntrophobacter fumaroxidans]|nr:OsmC family protein [Syntrophobacter fumaroxidans]